LKGGGGGRGAGAGAGAGWGLWVNRPFLYGSEKRVGVFRVYA